MCCLRDLLARRWHRFCSSKTRVAGINGEQNENISLVNFLPWKNEKKKKKKWKRRTNSDPELQSRTTKPFLETEKCLRATKRHFLSVSLASTARSLRISHYCTLSIEDFIISRHVTKGKKKKRKGNTVEMTYFPRRGVSIVIKQLPSVQWKMDCNNIFITRFLRLEKLTCR